MLIALVLCDKRGRELVLCGAVGERVSWTRIVMAALAATLSLGALLRQFIARSPLSLRRRVFGRTIAKHIQYQMKLDIWLYYHALLALVVRMPVIIPFSAARACLSAMPSTINHGGEVLRRLSRHASSYLSFFLRAALCTLQNFLRSAIPITLSIHITDLNVKNSGPPSLPKAMLSNIPRGFVAQHLTLVLCAAFNSLT